MPAKSPTPHSPKSGRSPWAKTTELVGITLILRSNQTTPLPAQYTTGLHAWFLDQVRQSDPELSASLHDNQTDKAFTLSELQGNFLIQSDRLHLQATQTYRWQITALSKTVAQWLAHWGQNLPPEIQIYNLTLTIQTTEITQPPTTYKKLWQNAETLLQAKQQGQKNYKLNQDTFTLQPPSVQLSFLSPTSFRRKGQHFPLPLPVNLFHSYLRRWNYFAHLEFDPDLFLEWIDESLLIHRFQLESTQVLAGKRGAVTGFTGTVEYRISSKATADALYEQLFFALAQLAPYCGTGHKTTFGLGQTQLGRHNTETAPATARQTLLTERISELTAIFLSQRKRTGGDRSTKIAETWATVLARRELGESLQAIATDLEMPYETVKTYSKLARRAVKI